MTGTTPTTFEPEAPLSRAMLATILWRMEGEPALFYRPIFDDVVSGRWYSEAVLWAYEEGVVLGTGPGIFQPEIDITREQFATMLYRYAQVAGHDVGVPSDFGLDWFGDSYDISDWAEEAMYWAVYNGLITGSTGGVLAPQAAASRAEAATILARFMERFDG